jgi:hypothetical protein
VRKEIREKIKVDFIGEVKYDPKLGNKMLQSIREKGLKEIVNLKPFLSHRDGLAVLCKSDVLLLVQMPQHVKDGSLASKLFEYLKAAKPILALVPHGSEMGKIIEETGAGIIASPTNVEEIENAILKMYELFQKGKLVVNADKLKIAKFERKQQVRQLVELFEKVIDGG